MIFTSLSFIKICDKNVQVRTKITNCVCEHVLVLGKSTSSKLVRAHWGLPEDLGFLEDVLWKDSMFFSLLLEVKLYKGSFLPRRFSLYFFMVWVLYWIGFSNIFFFSSSFMTWIVQVNPKTCQYLKKLGVQIVENYNGHCMP